MNYHIVIRQVLGSFYDRNHVLILLVQDFTYHCIWMLLFGLWSVRDSCKNMGGSTYKSCLTAEHKYTETFKSAREKFLVRSGLLSRFLLVPLIAYWCCLLPNVVFSLHVLFTHRHRWGEPTEIQRRLQQKRERHFLLTILLDSIQSPHEFHSEQFGTFFTCCMIWICLNYFVTVFINNFMFVFIIFVFVNLLHYLVWIELIRTSVSVFQSVRMFINVGKQIFRMPITRKKLFESIWEKQKYCNIPFGSLNSIITIDLI